MARSATPSLSLSLGTMTVSLLPLTVRSSRFCSAPWVRMSSSLVGEVLAPVSTPISSACSSTAYCWAAAEPDSRALAEKGEAAVAS